MLDYFETSKNKMVEKVWENLKYIENNDSQNVNFTMKNELKQCLQQFIDSNLDLCGLTNTNTNTNTNANTNK